jgi:hypothetical protein
MPKRKLTLTRTADRENRTLLSRLEQLGVQTGPAPPPEPRRLILEQIDEARIYQLPADAVGVVVPVKMIILKSVMITEVGMMLPWDDFPLDLSDAEDSPDNPNYKHLISRLPYHLPAINHLLTSDVPLSTQRAEGVIIAQGYSRVPPKYHDETRVKVELFLRDERHNELCFDFGVRVDRSVMLTFERRHRERLTYAQSKKRPGSWTPKRGQPGDQKGVSREGVNKPPYAPRKYDVTHNAKLSKPN